MEEGFAPRVGIERGSALAPLLAGGWAVAVLGGILESFTEGSSVWSGNNGCIYGPTCPDLHVRQGASKISGEPHGW